jgi:hypothetical protein
MRRRRLLRLRAAGLVPKGSRAVGPIGQPRTGPPVRLPQPDTGAAVLGVAVGLLVLGLVAWAIWPADEPSHAAQAHQDEAARATGQHPASTLDDAGHVPVDPVAPEESPKVATGSSLQESGVLAGFAEDDVSIVGARWLVPDDELQALAQLGPTDSDLLDVVRHIAAPWPALSTVRQSIVAQAMADAIVLRRDTPLRLRGLVAAMSPAMRMQTLDVLRRRSDERPLPAALLISP